MNRRINSPELPNRLNSPKRGKASIWISGGNEEIYLVNNSERVLSKVSASSGGFTSHDDGVIPSSRDIKYSYSEVLPGEAVLIEKLDGYYDLDFVHQLSLLIEDKVLGHLEILTQPDKGEIRTQALFWEEDTPSEKITIKEV